MLNGRKFLFLTYVLMAANAYADVPNLSRVNDNSAYKLLPITEEEYNNDVNGMVFKDYQVSEDGSLIAKYYRYELNDKKVYNETLTENISASGDGKDKVINVGLGLNNSVDISGADNVLYKDNQYLFDYTGTGASVYVRGGAVYNEGSIDNQNADYVGNSIIVDTDVADSVYVQGVALANKGDINQVKGDFVHNNASGSFVEGAALYNEGSGNIMNIAGDFIGNKAQGKSVKGGSIFNMGYVSSINGNFVANEIAANSQANGGAIQNNDSGALIAKIEGNFVSNKATGDLQAWGGAVDNARGTILDISSNFTNNQAIGNGRNTDALGGALSNQGKINQISGSFVENSAKAGRGAYGGAIYNDAQIGTLHANFINNSAAGQSEALGGAIYHDSDAALHILNSSFYGNKVESENLAQGGAVYANNVHIEANGADSVFKGNTANAKSNAVYIDNGSLTLTAQNNGNIIFDDAIDGEQYDVITKGDNSGEIVFNTTVDNVRDFNMTNGSRVHLGTDANIYTDNFNATNGVLTLDVMVDKDANSIHNGVITVDGNITGKTNVIINSLNEDKLADDSDAYGLFVQAPNDTVQSTSAFTISRVVGSPYMWSAVRNYQGEQNGSNWYFALDDSTHEFNPEVGAYAAMQTAAIEQNRGLSRKVGDGLHVNRNKGCCDKKFRTDKETWINADYTYAEIDAPSDMEAKIKGVTAGLDLAANRYHRLGLFGAYRQGDYTLSGKGDFFSKTGSEMDIDSYLGGLYYYYGRNKWSVLATAFAGKQDINMKTDDKIAHASTDAMQYGAGLEIGRQFYLPYAWIIEPSLGLYYTALDLDGFTDNLGKTVDFDLMHYVEAELGLRFEHLFCLDGWTTKFYAKPSIIQTFANGNETRITSLVKSKSSDNQTLGRMEIGAKFGLSPAFSAYTSAHYTMGDEYKAYGVDAGLVYSW